jgi:hypothetical protein
MPRRLRKATPKNIARFDRWLVDAVQSDFEEFLAATPKELGALSLELLRKMKARVDKRLAAEPDKNVFNPADPHDMRLSNWEKVSERLGAQINFRSGKSAKAGEESKPNARADGGPGNREAVLRRILKNKGLSVNDWAMQAGVDFHTANAYLNGKTKPYESTIAKLAKPLGLEAKDMPT